MTLLPRKGPGRPRTRSPRLRVTLITNDYQIPDIDWAVYRAVRNFLADLKPDYHYINGDFLDLYEQSGFEKDPARFGQTHEELELANRVLDELQAASPYTITKMTFGNHEARLTRRLFENPDLIPYFTSATTPDEVLARVLSLEEREIDWVPYRQGFDHFGFYITHGQATNIHPAHKEMSRYGISGVSGHVNRNTSCETKNKHGFAKWWSLGGLTAHNLNFNPNNNWVHGIGVLYQMVDSDEFNFYPIEIVDAKFIFNGTLYTQDGAFPAA